MSLILRALDAQREARGVASDLVEQLSGSDLAFEPLDLGRHRRSLGAREPCGVGPV
jgi:hypothetical protein